MMTLTKRAISYARKYPGRTATEIANALRAKPSSVSSILYRASKTGLLERKEGEPSREVPWQREGGGGPLGGATYYPCSSPAMGKPALERLSEGDPLC